jgi:hypothetical protein
MQASGFSTLRHCDPILKSKIGIIILILTRKWISMMRYALDRVKSDRVERAANLAYFLFD